ncbi:hypothetical protein [Dyella tabacisoli]|uniref:Uncharacterized protein n=1 Tax=Dyella tabacisoli TaxID=2282381 RepID=A0A369UST5_9GAMM|nr:hypothetical protein [Dyella tabacisoli]RDD83537.1 hypothetical protein DVJ77_02885 [Dyella tabacisoli]
MTKTFAANLALVFVLLGGIGIAMALGASQVDPGPGPVPMPNPYVIARWFGFGQISLLVGTWLAGFAFQSATRRSILALVAGGLLSTVPIWHLL